MVYVLYNPLADNGLGEKKLSVLRKELKDEERDRTGLADLRRGFMEGESGKRQQKRLRYMEMV